MKEEIVINKDKQNEFASPVEPVKREAASLENYFEAFCQLRKKNDDAFSERWVGSRLRRLMAFEMAELVMYDDENLTALEKILNPVKRIAKAIAATEKESTWKNDAERMIKDILEYEDRSKALNLLFPRPRDRGEDATVETVLGLQKGLLRRLMQIKKRTAELVDEYLSQTEEKE